MSNTYELRPTTRRRARNASILKATAAVLGLVALGAFAGAMPFASPGPMPPVGRLMNLVVTNSARGAYIKAMQADGYEITAPVEVILEDDA